MLRTKLEKKPAALVVAAGRGVRTGLDLPKQYVTLGGKSVLRRTLEALRLHDGVGAIQVVIRPGDGDLYEASVGGLPGLLPPVQGGATRQQSVRNGLEALAADAPQIVLVHDAARPFASPSMIAEVIAACDDTHGAIPVLAVNETVKRIEAGKVVATVPARGAGDRADAAGLSVPEASRCAQGSGGSRPRRPDRRRGGGSPRRPIGTRGGRRPRQRQADQPRRFHRGRVGALDSTGDAHVRRVSTCIPSGRDAPYGFAA